MVKGFKLKGIFHPTGNKKGKKSSKQKSVKPKEFKIFGFGEKKIGSIEDVTRKVTEDFKERDVLTRENEKWVEEIENKPMSEFNLSRKRKIKNNVNEIRRLEKDIKNNIKTLNKEQQMTLPVEIISEVRTF